MSCATRRDWKMSKRLVYVSGNSLAAALRRLASACCLVSLALATTPARAEPKPAAGQDVIVNGGFEDPGDRGAPAGWSNNAKDSAKKIKKAVGKKPAQVEFAWSDRQPHSGKRCLGIVSSYAEKSPWFRWEQKLQGMKPGEKYRLSVWVRSEGVSYGANLELQFADQAGQQLAGTPLHNIHKAGAKWAEVIQDIVVPAGAASGTIRLAMHGPGSVWLDDIHLSPAGGPAAQRIETGQIYPVAATPKAIVLDGHADEWAGAAHQGGQGR